jgi:hypothetical protein
MACVPPVELPITTGLLTDSACSPATAAAAAGQRGRRPAGRSAARAAASVPPPSASAPVRGATPPGTASAQARLGHHRHRTGGQRLQRHLAAVGGQRRADHGRDGVSPSAGAGRSGRPCRASRCPAAARRAGSCGWPAGEQRVGRAAHQLDLGVALQQVVSVWRTMAESSMTYTLTSCRFPGRYGDLRRVGPTVQRSGGRCMPPRSCCSTRTPGAAAPPAPSLALPAHAGAAVAHREHVAAAVDVGLAQPRRDAAPAQQRVHRCSAGPAQVVAAAAPASTWPACTMWHMAPTVRRGSVSTMATQEPSSVSSRSSPHVAQAHIGARMQGVQHGGAAAHDPATLRKAPAPAPAAACCRPRGPRRCR